VGCEIISFLRFDDDIALLTNNEHNWKNRWKKNYEMLSKMSSDYQLAKKLKLYDVPKRRTNKYPNWKQAARTNKTL
jgi:hypothetical protein